MYFCLTSIKSPENLINNIVMTAQCYNYELHSSGMHKMADTGADLIASAPLSIVVFQDLENETVMH